MYDFIFYPSITIIILFLLKELIIYYIFNIIKIFYKYHHFIITIPMINYNNST